MGVMPSQAEQVCFKTSFVNVAQATTSEAALSDSSASSICELDDS